MKAYIVNYLKTDRSRNVQTVVVKAKSWDEAIEKANEEVGGFYDVGEIDVMSLAEAKRKSLLSNPMKKKTRKKVVRRKRRPRKSMSEKRVMQIKRGLMKGTKKLRLGAKRTGAYVYGTLRRIVGNPVMFVRTKDDIEKVRKQLDNGFLITEVSKTRNGIRVLLSMPRPGERIVYGESFNEYANRVFVPMLRKNPGRGIARNPYVSKILGDMKSQQLKYRGFTIILERQPNTILATWTDGDTLQSQRYSGYSFREVFEVVKDEIDDLIKPSRPGMLRGNPRLGKYEQKALNFARKYPGWHGFDPRKPTANIVRRLEKKGLVKVSDISNQFRAI